MIAQIRYLLWLHLQKVQHNSKKTAWASKRFFWRKFPTANIKITSCQELQSRGFSNLSILKPAFILYTPLWSMRAWWPHLVAVDGDLPVALVDSGQGLIELPQLLQQTCIGLHSHGQSEVCIIIPS